MPALAASENDAAFGDWLLTLPAFYAELVPGTRQRESLDHLYLMRDCGVLTLASQNLFASPFREVCFTFRGRSGETSLAPSLVVAQPTFGSRRRKRPFNGWAFGIRSYPTSSFAPAQNHPALGSCLATLADVNLMQVSWRALLEILDGAADELLEATRLPPHEMPRLIEWSRSEAGMARLASAVNQSPRTLQRKIRRATGLSPKQLFAIDRFDRAVRAVSMPKTKLSQVACDLRFSDQAHLTREFQRHAGLSPGAFKGAWQSCPGQAVRFFQDNTHASRLRMAAWVIEV
jgi:AraC-like DNA-binding protein